MMGLVLFMYILPGDMAAAYVDRQSGANYGKANGRLILAPNLKVCSQP